MVDASHMSQRQAALTLSLGAGMATGIGASFVLCTSSLNRTLLACTMSFSSGVMIYVSLVEVISVSNEHFSQTLSPAYAYACATASFFAGVVAMAVIDRCVHLVFDCVTSKSLKEHSERGSSPNVAMASGCAMRSTDEEAGLCRDDHPHEDESAGSIIAVASIAERRRLLMMSAVVSAAIVLHNIPEGMATYVASFHSVSAGLPLAIAIAIHNIPEGLAIAMPVFYATKSRSRAITLGTLSGFSEPFGAVLASLVANENSSNSSFGFTFGLTAGMMSYVCLAELLPAAFGEKGVSRETVVFAFFLGCAVMASSIVIEKFATA